MARSGHRVWHIVAMSLRAPVALAGGMNTTAHVSPTPFAFRRTMAAARTGHLGSVTLDPRHNGPRGSANGGFASGTFASIVGSPARVVLRARVPLGVGLDVTRSADDSVTVTRGSRLIAEVTRLDRGVIRGVPTFVPTVEEALAASLGTVGLERSHPLAHCWVCSRYRADGLGVEPGFLHGHPEALVARFRAPGAGVVAEPLVWAALDCPSYPVHALHTGQVFVLGTQAVEMHRPVPAGADYAIVGWTEGGAGRKYRTASVLIDTKGEVLASSEAIWVEVAGLRARALSLSTALRGTMARAHRPAPEPGWRLSLR